ncbi:PorP/SprF family type IX secretion system membrane protein [Flavisolibacter ginsengisoli]|jgi:type IX secretion system PorP/SprF family membrane protein|uniref:Type IX secretion system membrane protein, PorP/SprF family n=1 Tax=Flavisolibacter ginsengisoli DSM 18119 TaxID=1121884 RepID=A0A1M4W7S5_9BACT|nr:PorP/SprF family type IX secretion system membrane protein [Flavisolibacter ginsengisoli]SHE77200.1 type IX secretion system membrane protein, PorP/SprF family [Flavisolibacter ginsengisoli DSM 18119]
MRKLLFCFSLICCVFSLKAQDPNFSQFFASPLTLNPALTGKFDGVFRVAGNYRNQWPTINNAFTTATISMDAGILRNTIPDYDQFGVGIMAFTDKSGNGVLQNNFLALSTAYHKALDENGFHQIGLGFQGTYVNKRLDIASLKFESMLRSDGFTGLMDESFSSNQIKLSYFDMNLGVLYNGTTDGSNNFYFGASMYHVNHPKETFKQGNYLLDPRVTIQAGGMVPVGEYNAFHFSANHSRQANATNTVIGGAYMINVAQDLGNPTNLYLGSWYRFGDAIIPYVGLEFGEFQLGASYDVNTSSLKPASNMRGGAEISLIYIKKHTDPNAKKLNCPKF